MATPFDIANFNLTNFADNYNNIFDSTPVDVIINVKDSNGNITTKTVANRGKFKQQLWDDVGNALGQFDRTFYVDAVNGDDTNDGSLESPFKTIKKACDSVPIGGYGVINLKTDNNIIDEDIYLKNKTIIIDGALIDSSSTVPAIKNTCRIDSYGNATYGFIMTNSYLEFKRLTIRTADFIDTTKVESCLAGLIKRWSTQSKNKVIVNESSILIGDTDFIRVSNRQDINLQVYNHDYAHSVTNKTIDCVGANRNGLLINNERGTIIFNTSSHALGTENDGSTSLNWNGLVSNVVKDTNGVPRNLLSNVIF